MTTQATETAVRHSIVVDAPSECAFAVYAEQSFANPEHHLRDAPMEQLVLEPREGGRWYERSVDGGECDWGRVLVWEPPHRLALAWQISPSFGFEPDSARASEVEVRAAAGAAARLDLRLPLSRDSSTPPRRTAPDCHQADLTHHP